MSTLYCAVFTTSSRVEQYVDVFGLHTSLMVRKPDVAEHITLELSKLGQTTEWITLLLFKSKTKPNANTYSSRLANCTVHTYTTNLLEAIMKFFELTKLTPGIKIDGPAWIYAKADSVLARRSEFVNMEFTMLPPIKRGAIMGHKGLEYNLRFGILSWFANYGAKFTTLLFGVDPTKADIRAVLNDFNLADSTFWTSTQYRAAMFDGLTPGWHRVVVIYVSGLLDDAVRRTLHDLAALKVFAAPENPSTFAPFCGKVIIISPIPLALEFTQETFFRTIPIDGSTQNIQDYIKVSIIDNLEADKSWRVRRTASSRSPLT